MRNHYAMSKLKRSMPMQAIRISSDKISQPMIRCDDITNVKINIMMIQVVCESIHKTLLMTMKNNEPTRLTLKSKNFVSIIMQELKKKKHETIRSHIEIPDWSNQGLTNQHPFSYMLHKFLHKSCNNLHPTTRTPKPRWKSDTIAYQLLDLVTMLRN